ncbi:glycosyltransferase family 2 protein [bacterium]|nr:glycosyltransferase family 2 protein [bacterium]
MITGFVFTSYIAVRTYRSKLLISKFNNDKNLDYKNLPTISVLVPARNETNDLLRCLDSIARSDYPKMEVIVLDDCSTELKTPQIIGDFAQQGMKFIAGSEPEKEWTAKNWAYQQLVEASSGEYLIFLGVDVIVKPDSFTKLISTISSQKKKMISLIPINVFKNFDIGYYLNQPMRYLIELILPNSIIKSAPAISTLWAIDRKAFNKLGGMKSVERTVMPEKYFARELSKENSYLFAASDKTLGIYSDKSRADQKDTSIRLTYPTLRKRPEVVSIFILLFSLSAIMPFISLLVGIINSNIYIFIFGLINILVLIFSVAMVNYLAYRRIGIVDSLIAPVSLLYTAGIAFRSMYDYEYSEVNWKKRNVCIPVMRQY